MQPGDTDYLNYERYPKGACTTVLSDTNPIAYTGTGAAASIIHGQIGGVEPQAAQKGASVDTLGLAITYPH